MEQEKLNINLSNKRLFKMLVLPSIVMFVVTGLIQLGDRLIGAFFIGENTLAILTIISPILIFVIAFAVMIVSGLGIEINFLLGKKEQQKAYGLSTFVLTIMFVILSLSTILLLLIREPIIDALISSPLSKSDASIYFLWVSLTFLPLGLGYTIGTTIMADGNGAFTMISQITLSLSNLIFNLIFVLLFDLGILGLGLGTFLSALCFLWLNSAYYLFKLNNTFRFGKIIIDFKEFAKILYNGLSEFLSVGAFAFSMLIINTILIINLSHQYFLAFSTLAIFITIYSSTQNGGIMGSMPVISKALGEGRYNKIDSFSIYVYIRTLIISTFIFLITSFLVKPISSVFLTEQSTVNLLYKLYWTLGAAYILYINSIFISGFLSALKKPFLSIIATVSKTVIITPILMFIFVTNFAEKGVLLALISVEILILPILIPLVIIARKQIRNSEVDDTLID